MQENCLYNFRSEAEWCLRVNWSIREACPHLYYAWLLALSWQLQKNSPFMHSFWMYMLLPAPITLSIRILEGSISFANSWTARDGSSYVSGSIYVLIPGKRTAKQRECWVNNSLILTYYNNMCFTFFFFLINIYIYHF